MTEEFDTFLERLSKKQRMEALRNAYPEDYPTDPAPPTERPRMAAWRPLLAILVGLPLALVGVILCASIVFIPVGLLFLLLSGLPLTLVLLKRIEKHHESE